MSKMPFVWKSLSAGQNISGPFDETYQKWNVTNVQDVEKSSPIRILISDMIKCANKRTKTSNE